MAIFSIADTFIKRPVLTTVCTILIVLLGGICIPLLPVMNLPDIALIQVQVSSAYVGADAQTVENIVTTTLERGINGVEGTEYMTSQSTNNGFLMLSGHKIFKLEQVQSAGNLLLLISPIAFRCGFQDGCKTKPNLANWCSKRIQTAA
jgi:hypothetical protein